MMKRCLAFLLILLLVPLYVFAEEAAAKEDHTVERRTYPHVFVWRAEDEPAEEEMDLFFVDGGDIPYVALSEYILFLTRLAGTVNGCEYPMEITREETTGSYLVTRTDNGSMMAIDPEGDRLLFSSFNSFLQPPGNSALVNVMNLPDPRTGEADMTALFGIVMEHQAELEKMSPEEQRSYMMPYLQEMLLKEPEKENSFFAMTRLINREGAPFTLNLKDYQIEIIDKDGECYLPFQVMNNLLVSGTYIHYIFNGQKIIGDVYSMKLQDQLYEAAPEPMSPEMALYNFHALQLFLDNFYGLKEEHRIDSFFRYIAIDLKMLDRMIGTDSADFEAALSSLLLMYLDDGHSGFLKSSWRTGDTDADPMNIFSKLLNLMNEMGYSNGSKMKTTKRLNAARLKVYPDKVPGYEEVGDTVFVTFDTFEFSRKPEEYYTLESFDDPQDTVELILYAHRQITRENSPVKNIVLDLSMNGGGNVDAAVAVASWFTGDATIQLRDTMTGAETIASYRTDINLNNQIVNDPGDNVAGGDYRLFCLVSGQSFSCGNLLPAICKQSGIVTLIGQRTGGGSNSVLPATTASGAFFRISGTKQLSTSVNGSFYNIDTGIEPDVILTSADSYYDRQGLVDMIHGLK